LPCTKRFAGPDSSTARCSTESPEASRCTPRSFPQRTLIRGSAERKSACTPRSPPGSTTTRVATGERYVSLRNVTRYAPGFTGRPRTGVVLVCSNPSPSTVTTAGGSAVSLSVPLATGGGVLVAALEVPGTDETGIGADGARR
jgi:hypothetical protein